MSIRQRVALVFAGLVLVVVAGCTQPSAPGASAQPAQSEGTVPSTDAGPGMSTQPAPSKGRGDY
jgi:hypothetical protein